jgi:hypothetical protein
MSYYEEHKILPFLTTIPDRLILPHKGQQPSAPRNMRQAALHNRLWTRLVTHRKAPTLTRDDAVRPCCQPSGSRMTPDYAWTGMVSISDVGRQTDEPQHETPLEVNYNLPVSVNQ